MIAAPTAIVGAGLAGLLAAHAWPGVDVYEAEPEPREAHRALLRFRTDAVSQLTGVPFRRVRVRKGLWSGGAFRPCDIGLANMYARKATGSVSGDRSIWALDEVERFVAPLDFYAQLVAAVGPRIRWGTSFDFGRCAVATPIVSTAPLPLVTSALGVRSARGLALRRASIHVQRYRIDGADVFQTVYFPDEDVSVLRASITGSTLIVESTQPLEEDDLSVVLWAFALERDELEDLGRVEQKHGKIVPLPDAARKSLLFELTSLHGVFSLGRFATWRNTLLDDVVSDIAAIRRLLRSDALAYDLKRNAALPWERSFEA